MVQKYLPGVIKGDKRIFIEDAFWLSMYASIPMYCFIFFIHLFFYPKNTNDYAEVLTFPPTLMLFSMNTAFFISSINRYHFQIYDLPKFFDFNLQSITTSSIFPLMTDITFV